VDQKMLSNKKDLSDILQDKFPHLRFSVIKENGMAIVNYDPEMTEDEEMQVHELLDNLRINYRMERMVF